MHRPASDAQEPRFRHGNRRGSDVWCIRRCPVSADRKQLPQDSGNTAPTVRERRGAKLSSWRWSPGRWPRPSTPAGFGAAAPGRRDRWPATAPRARRLSGPAPGRSSTTPTRSRSRRCRRSCPPVGPWWPPVMTPAPRVSPSTGSGPLEADMLLRDAVQDARLIGSRRPGLAGR